MSSVGNKFDSEAFRCLASKQEPPPGNKGLDFKFLRLLLEIFGLQYVCQIKKQLPRLCHQFKDLTKACQEISVQLSEGKPISTITNCVANYLKIYKEQSRTEIAILHDLTETSYLLFPYPQQILISRNLDRKMLQKIEDARDRAFRNLCGRLDFLTPSVREEEKSVCSKMREWSLSEEVEVGILYYNSAASINGETFIPFSTAILGWKEIDCSVLFAKLKLQNWVNVHKPDCIPRLKGNSFFVAYRDYTIELLQEKLQIQFSSNLRRKIADACVDESTRGDLEFFVAYPFYLYELDLSQPHLTSRSGKNMLQSLQLFLWIRNKFGVEKNKQSALLDMVVFGGSNWPLLKDQRFLNRSLRQDQSEDEDSQFSDAWECFEKTLSAISGIDINLDKPCSDTQNLLQEPYCGPLFCLIWQRRKGKIFATIFQNLKDAKQFRFDVKIIYNFFVSNGFDWSKDHVGLIVEVLQAVVGVVGNAENTKYLLFDPPLNIQKSITSLDPKRVAQRTTDFVSWLEKFEVKTYSKHFFELLRHFILHPNLLILELLGDASLLGIKEYTIEFLKEVICADHQKLEPFSKIKNENRGKEIRERALGRVLFIQQKFHFSNLEIFNLYLENLYLGFTNTESEIRQIADVVNALQNFCPAVRKKDIYFLFLFHPQASVKDIERLENLRIEYANSELIDTFFIPEDLEEKISQEIEMFISKLSGLPSESNFLDYSSDILLDMRRQFAATLRISLEYAFNAYKQMIQDYCRISGLSIGKIKWGTPEVASHEGELRPVLPGSKIGVYCHWDVFDNHPVFYLSFWTENRAISQFVPIYVSAKEVEEDQRRRPFYNLLAAVSNWVFGKQRDFKKRDPNQKVWTDRYDGLTKEIKIYDKDIEAGNLKEEEKNAILDFVRTVLIRYRHLFLCAIANRSYPEYPQDNSLQVAALGYIFPSHPRGSLLPETYLKEEEIKKNTEAFIPDVPLQIIESLREFFWEKTKELRGEKPEEEEKGLKFPNAARVNMKIQLDLGLVLSVDYEISVTTDMDKEIGSLGRTNGAYVYFSVQSNNRLIRVPLQYSDEIMKDRDRFSKHFDFHIITLKAMVYYNMNAARHSIAEEEEKADV